VIPSPLLAADRPPLDPTAPEARQWIVDELAHGEYRQARPNLVDQAIQALLHWLDSLQAPRGAAPGGIGLLVVLAVLAAVVVVAFLVFGLPRLRRRSGLRGALFGDADDRSADELRASAERAAAAGDWATAVVERYRAIARALVVRTVVVAVPGTTARGLAARAAVAFPDHATALATAADDFDDVRYLGRPATPDRYARVRALDEALAGARPALEAVPA
jgi:hypothetical protein